jgi:ankyrin repeat protein
LIGTHGADVNAQDKDKDTPIHRAFRYFDPKKGGITVLTYLLSQKGIDGNIKDKSGYTLLHRACISINRLPLDVFKLLIENGGCDVNAQDNDNDTLFHHALELLNPHNGGDITAFASLINQKAFNVNTKGWYGHTLLHSACFCHISDFDDYIDSEDDSYDDYTDSDDDFADLEESLDNHREAKADTFLCQIVEAIAERCVQQVLDEATS